jgi:hypothetical protein
MKTGSKIAVISILSVIALFSVLFAAAFFESDEIGCLDPEIADRYGWVEVNTDSAISSGISYAAWTYMPEERLGDMIIMTYSYPVPRWLMGDTVRELALQTAIRSVRSSYDMTFDDVERRTERMNGGEGEVVYIDFTAKTPLTGAIVPSTGALSSLVSVAGLNVSAVSHGKFIIALFAPAAGFRDRFVVIVSYALTKHEVYLGNNVIYHTQEDLSTYDEMRDLVLNHVILRPA